MLRSWFKTELKERFKENIYHSAKWNGLCRQLINTSFFWLISIVFSRNVMSDFGGEVMAEVLAERALVRPQIIPLVPLTNQYRHQDHMDLKDYKSKVRLTIKMRILTLEWVICKKLEMFVMFTHAVSP